MAILWADNFKNYGTDDNKLLDGLYAQIGGASITGLTADPSPDATGNVFLVGSGTAGFLRHVFSPAGVAIAGISARFWFTNIPTSTGTAPNFIQFRDTGNTTQVSIALSPSGLIEAWRGTTNSGILLGTSGTGIAPNSWNHIEARVEVSDTVGTVEVRVNGIVVLSLSNQDTRTGLANLSQVAFASGYGQTTFSQSTNFYLKDYIAWDTSGTVNNSFLGTCAVISLYPDVDDSFAWTPSTGSTGFNLIDEATPNDSDYISAGDPPPAASEFGLTNLPPDIVSVKALLPITRSRKIDGGDGNLQAGLKGTLTDLGANNPITTSFTYRWDVSELSPDTGAAWTPVEVDNVKLQVNRTL